MLNRAAALRGQKLSEFMLDSARRRAEEAILDQRVFFLDDRAHAAFLKILDAPPKPTKALRALMARKPAFHRLGAVPVTLLALETTRRALAE